MGLSHRGVRGALKQPGMGKSICWLYIHTSDVKPRPRQAERLKGVGGWQEGHVLIHAKGDGMK